MSRNGERTGGPLCLPPLLQFSQLIAAPVPDHHFSLNPESPPSVARPRATASAVVRLCVSLWALDRPSTCSQNAANHLLGSGLNLVYSSPSLDRVPHAWRGDTGDSELSLQMRGETNKRAMITVNDCMHLHGLFHDLR